MDTASLIAIAVAVLVALIGLARAAGARTELETVKAELDATKTKLEETQKKLRALQAAPPKKAAPAPAKVKDKAPEPEPEPTPEPEEVEEPKVDDRQLKRRAEKILKDARLMARHVGFEKQIEIDGKKGVRVAVEISDELDTSALEYLRTTSDAVLDAGEKDGEHFVVVRG